MTSRFAVKPNLVWNPEWLDVLAFGSWGVLMLRYWLTGRLGLLIHPNYFWLAIAAGFALLIIAFFQGWKILVTPPLPSVRHITLFPPGWMSGVLLVAAIAGLLITPRPFTSDTALQRGLADSLTVTRARPQSFRATLRPENRSLVDWVRTLDVYPEPDAYTGQKVKVQGFVVYSPNLSDQYLTLTRFVITCCAADAYPIGLPVKLSHSRQTYPPDRWFQVQGKMITETLAGKRQLVIAATSLEPIPEPANPFAY
jgi:uncharacterized repeat protein (TIGR03943 family)